jgi:hypothetical protein
MNRILVTFSKSEPKVSLQERKRNETKVAEKYCWAITRQQSGYAEAYHVPVCWILVFKWNPLSIHT